MRVLSLVALLAYFASVDATTNSTTNTTQTQPATPVPTSSLSHMIGQPSTTAPTNASTVGPVNISLPFSNQTVATTAATSAPAAGELSVSQANITYSVGQSISNANVSNNLAICNVIDPTRIEAPWHDSNNAYPQVYDANKYVCVDGNFLCPTTAPLRCQYACYTSTQYYCENGQLYQVGTNAQVTSQPTQTVQPTVAPATTVNTTNTTTTSSVTSAKSAFQTLRKLLH